MDGPCLGKTCRRGRTQNGRTKEDTAALERAMLDGQEAMGTVLASLGEMGLGQSTNKIGEKEERWKSVGSEEAAD